MAYKIARNALMIATALAVVACQSGRVATAMNPKPKVGAGMAALQAKMEAAVQQQVRFDGIEPAEAAVRAAPDSLEARRALAQAYFDAGRFRSAAQAYDDALAIAPADDSLRLRKALALLAQGNQAAARAELDRLRDACNAGLAFALAGRTGRAVDLLMQAARQPEASAQTRQNLALALALAGQWAQARTVAAQDLEPTMVEIRIRQWAEFAASADPALQTASLLRVTPVASDYGRPIGLAYVPPSERLVQQAAAPAAPVEAIMVAAVPAEAQPAAQLALAANELTTGAGTADRRIPGKPGTVSASAAMSAQWVVQLGAYDRADLLEANWRHIAQRNAKLLGDYEAVRSEVTIGDRRFHRLAITGFASRSAASDLCGALQAKGRDCFVRSLNPTAVQLADLKVLSRT